jgi:hypothetical protein
MEHHFYEEWESSVDLATNGSMPASTLIQSILNQTTRTILRKPKWDNVLSLFRALQWFSLSLRIKGKVTWIDLQHLSSPSCQLLPHGFWLPSLLTLLILHQPHHHHHYQVFFLFMEHPRQVPSLRFLHLLFLYLKSPCYFSNYLSNLLFMSLRCLLNHLPFEAITDQPT